MSITEQLISVKNEIKDFFKIYHNVINTLAMTDKYEYKICFRYEGADKTGLIIYSLREELAEIVEKITGIKFLKLENQYLFPYNECEFSVKVKEGYKQLTSDNPKSQAEIIHNAIKFEFFLKDQNIYHLEPTLRIWFHKDLLSTSIDEIIDRHIKNSNNITQNLLEI